MPSTDNIVVLTNCGSAREARKIARALVKKRLAACANIVTAPVQSVYRWEEKIETAKEVLLLVKTSRSRFDEVEREIRELHSYDVPEIIAVPIAAGSRAYLNWLAESVR